MRGIYFILYFGVFMGYAQAQDPFDKTQRKISVEENMIHNLMVDKTNKNCTENTRNIATDVSFYKLKFIGVIQNKNQKEALFIDELENIFSLTVGETIGKEYFVLKTVDLNELHLQHWINNQCKQSEILIVKL